METKEKGLAKPRASTLPALGYFQPEMLEQALRVADKFFKAKCFGKDVTSAEIAYVKIQAGAEMGMPPMEAMNSLYIVNGKITIWGAAMSKRMREHGWKIEFLESTDKICKCKISKGSESYEETATADDVKKTGAYSFAPKDKLKWHCLSRLIRFNVPEVLGPVSYSTEEAEDFIEAATVNVINDPVVFESLKREIEACESMDQFAIITQKITDTKNIFTSDEMKSLQTAAIAKRKELKKPEEQPKEEPEEVTEEEEKQSSIKTPQDYE